MRTEFKKITVEREVYIADDGTEFEFVDDCRNHELMTTISKLELYDRDLNPTTDMGRAIYAYLATGESVTTFIAVNRQMDYSTKGLDEPGLYMYDSDYDMWRNITDVIKKFKDIV